MFELANGPTSTKADDFLFAGMVPVVPDILANSGGVTVSTYEWEQNLKGERWSEEEVFAKLKTNLQTQALHVLKKRNPPKLIFVEGLFSLLFAGWKRR